MPPASPRSFALVIVGVAGALALSIGLVRSGGRDGSRPRSARPIVEVEQAEPANLRVALTPAPSEPSAPPVQAPAATPAAASDRRELPRLSGLVLRPEGDPASEARVVLGDQQARCRPDGRFELVLSASSGAGDLLVFEPGYEPVLRPAVGASLAPGSAPELRIVLGPSTLSLTGVVITRDGRALAGWKVELDGLDPLAAVGLREPTLTDAEGRFVLPDVPSGIHVVRTFAARRELAFRSAPSAAGEEGLVITVDAGR
jgi:hypothetical protein